MAITLISSITTTGAAASLDFTSIPSIYTDLKIVASLRVTDGGEGTNPPISRCSLVINGTSSGNLYNIVMAYGLPNNSPTANSAGGADANVGFYMGTAASSNATSNTFSNYEYYIPGYSESDKHKVLMIDGGIENNSIASGLDMMAGMWNSTSAITSLSLKPYNGGNFATNTTAYLYGISKS